ncbi:MAG: methylated-DNA--[protein]-cysteine S-methyltransferase [Burkholderiaceae bacterium]
MNEVAWLRHDSPIGPLLLAATAHGLRALYMAAHRHVADEPAPTWIPAERAEPAAVAILQRAREQLDAYFAGRRIAFDLPIDVDGSPFQRAVWAGLRTIPFGETISYGELARRIGNAKAVRAVGLANGRNPVSIVVPCHRVIGADGSMTGYGGGIDRKVFLLALEAGVRGAVRPGERCLV